MSSNTNISALTEQILRDLLSVTSQFADPEGTEVSRITLWVN